MYPQFQCSSIYFIDKLLTLFEVVRKQVDNKGVVNTACEACSSIASAGNSILCGDFVVSLNANISFELLAAAVEGKNVATNKRCELASVQISQLGILKNFNFIWTIARQR